jgi:16S rRNA (uracil1498-N3)-methyltransferase
MQLFYGTDIDGNVVTLSEQESAHCVRVLRMNRGDAIQVTDGNGHLFSGTIQLAHDKRTTVEITETTRQPQSSYHLHLYVALTKHADRLEWMLEKCVEMGLASFTPLITHRTERKNIRVDRLEMIALSAMKQSLKAWLPVVHPAAKVADAFKQAGSGTKLIAHCANDEQKIVLSEIKADKEVHIFIGPEGDFTLDEVSSAMEQGFQQVSLGPSRLRTETAGLTACSWMYWYNIKTQERI